MKGLVFVLLCSISISATAATVAEKLTELSLDKRVKASSPEVKRTQAALTRGLTVCDGKDEEALASSAWVMTKEIREKGQYADSTDILEGINAVLLGAKSKQDCDELLALYTVNRIQGNTHSDAVTGARGLYRATGVVQ
ncbi:hypothetical protein [Pseudomonas sp. zfem002]|uniref:hypothetical protein n=1 Tax=Pseudomonas sp. zfem002 TaxID=3078197 RepID=UPI0029294657|nr:hypothetical protein [Pseudomonas sp. zfem002]MDU9392128.1 hypothetical protein [Pseudomonas sp. zfem002]